MWSRVFPGIWASWALFGASSPAGSRVSHMAKGWSPSLLTLCSPGPWAGVPELARCCWKGWSISHTLHFSPWRMYISVSVAYASFSFDNKRHQKMYIDLLPTARRAVIWLQDPAESSKSIAPAPSRWANGEGCELITSLTSSLCEAQEPVEELIQ